MLIGMFFVNTLLNSFAGDHLAGYIAYFGSRNFRHGARSVLKEASFSAMFR